MEATISISDFVFRALAVLQLPLHDDFDFDLLNSYR